MSLYAILLSAWPLGAVSVREISIESLVLLVVNVMLVVASTIIIFSVRRMVAQNDSAHSALHERCDTLQHRADEREERLDARLEKLADALSAEREQRHQCAGAIEQKLWGMNADLKEHYPTRRETMRQYGTLVQTINDMSADIGNRLDELPCRQVRCPQETSP